MGNMAIHDEIGHVSGLSSPLVDVFVAPAVHGEIDFRAGWGETSDKLHALPRIEMAEVSDGRPLGSRTALGLGLGTGIGTVVRYEDRCPMGRGAVPIDRIVSEGLRDRRQPNEMGMGQKLGECR